MPNVEDSSILKPKGMTIMYVHEIHCVKNCVSSIIYKCLHCQFSSQECCVLVTCRELPYVTCTCVHVLYRHLATRN